MFLGGGRGGGEERKNPQHGMICITHCVNAHKSVVLSEMLTFLHVYLARVAFVTSEPPFLLTTKKFPCRTFI